jgi:hypothetical protein
VSSVKLLESNHVLAQPRNDLEVSDRVLVLFSSAAIFSTTAAHIGITEKHLVDLVTMHGMFLKHYRSSPYFCVKSSFLE